MECSEMLCLWLWQTHTHMRVLRDDVCGSGRHTHTYTQTWRVMTGREEAGAEREVMECSEMLCLWLWQTHTHIHTDLMAGHDRT